MTSSSRNYVALGDSVSIDDYAGGSGQGAASLLFLNNDEKFPDSHGRDLLSTEFADNLVLLAETAPPLPTLSGARCHCSTTFGSLLSL